MTYPFGKLRRWSLCGPSCWKLETRNQLVWRLSLGPYDVPTTYFTTSCPVDVACSSGSAPRRPVMIRRATERAGDELKERAEKVVAGARRKGRRGVKAGIVWYGDMRGIKTVVMNVRRSMSVVARGLTCSSIYQVGDTRRRCHVMIGDRVDLRLLLLKEHLRIPVCLPFQPLWHCLQL